MTFGMFTSKYNRHQYTTGQYINKPSKYFTNQVAVETAICDFSLNWTHLVELCFPASLPLCQPFYHSPLILGQWKPCQPLKPFIHIMSYKFI